MSRETVSRRSVAWWTGLSTFFCMLGLATIGGPDRWMMLASGCFNATVFCVALLQKD